MILTSSHNSIFRGKTLIALVTGIFLYSQTVWSIVQAQSDPDIKAPVIDLELLEESVADQTQVFSALVADDRELANVTLYHRRAGQQPFSPIAMNPLGDTGYYSVSLTTDPDDIRAIEYYVQARDAAGNRTVSGYAFDPFQRLLTKTTAELAETSATESSSTPSTAASDDGGISIWSVALGVVLLGALAAAAGSGGGSDNSVPLTVNIGDPL